MSRPGGRLRAAAARVFSTQTMTRLIDPIVADIQAEHEAARRGGGVWSVARAGIIATPLSGEGSPCTRWWRVRARCGLYKRAYHQRFALPTATVALSLLGLGIVAVFRRRAVMVLVLVAAVGAYYELMMLADSNGSTTLLPAVVSVWLPNVLCAGVAVAAIRGAPLLRALRERDP